MKKILFVIDNLNMGGVEKSLLTLLDNINSNDYRIDILPLVSKGILEKDFLSKKIDILTLPKSKYDTKLLSNSFKKTVFDYFKNFSFFKIFKLVSLIIKGKCNKWTREMSISESVRCTIVDSFDNLNKSYDIAVGYIDRQYSYYVIKKVNAKRKFMWIHSDYDVVDDSIKGYYETYKKFDSIICVSNKAKSSFLNKFNSLSDKIVIINDALDIKKMDSAKPYNFGNNSVNLLAVGRLSPEKRFLHLIDIFNIINNRVSKEIKLYIVGDGPEFGLIAKKIDDLNLKDKVVLLGNQDDPYQFIKSSDLFLQPSIKEGFCLTIYEALYLKKFVIAYDIADIKNIIDDGINGYICEDDTCFIEKTISAIEGELYNNKNISLSRNHNSNVNMKIKKLFEEDR